MKKRILTGIKPTGIPHIGNYFGAIKPAISLMEDESAECFYFIADIHALTTIDNKKDLQQHIYEVACTWLACGLEPDKAIFYRQSDISDIFELFSILTNLTPKGLMNRAHAYKAATDGNRATSKEMDYGINMGLYNYPILMAADILLFNTDFVPVGLDQKQHIEVARDIASYFNHRYNSNIKLPEGLISEDVMTLPGIDGRKMSKSYNNIIPLFESEKMLRKKIFSIVTDSTGANEPKDLDNTIYQIYKAFVTDEKIREFAEKFNSGISWAEAKEELFVAANNYLAPMREKYNYYMNNKDVVDKILNRGAERAKMLAKNRMNKIRKTVGLQQK